jgi:hypothetical protein
MNINLVVRLQIIIKIFTIFAANLKIILTSYKNGISYRT